MDTTARRAEFARNITEASDIMVLMRTQARANCAAIASSRMAIDESWFIIKSAPLKTD